MYRGGADTWIIPAPRWEQPRAAGVQNGSVADGNRKLLMQWIRLSASATTSTAAAQPPHDTSSFRSAGPSGAGSSDVAVARETATSSSQVTTHRLSFTLLCYFLMINPSTKFEDPVHIRSSVMTSAVGHHGQCAYSHCMRRTTWPMYRRPIFPVYLKSLTQICIFTLPLKGELNLDNKWLSYN